MVSVRETTPEALATAVDANEVTLVIGAPGVGKSHAVGTLDWPVRQLTAIEDDDGPVVVDEFIEDLCSNHNERIDAVYTLENRSAGAVMVTRPQSLDWYFQTYEDDTRFDTLLDRFDKVLIVRIPPGEANEVVRDMLEDSAAMAAPGSHGSASNDLSEANDVRPLAMAPAYEYQSPYLARHLGWYDRTVLPGELAALTVRERESVVMGSALTETLGEHSTDLRQFIETAIRPADVTAHDDTPGVVVEYMFPDGAVPQSLPAFDDPALEAAVALVASHVVTGDTDWLDTVTEVSVLPAATEAIETTLSLPPGTMQWVSAFASEGARDHFLERISDDSHGDEVGTIDRSSDGDTSEELRAAVESHADQLEQMRAVFDVVESVATPATEHEDAFVPEYQQETHTLEQFYPPQEDPVDASEQADDLDTALDAFDDNLVIVTGSRGEGVYAVARRVGERLTDWGVDVCIPPVNGLDTLEKRFDVLGEPVCLIKVANRDGISLDPGQLAAPDDIGRVLDLLGAGHTRGVVIGCPERYLDTLRDGVESADAADHPAWSNREVVSVSSGGAVSDDPPTPEEVAQRLLTEMGLGRAHEPTYPEIASVDGRSDLAVLAGTPDSEMGPVYLGDVLAAAAIELSTTHQAQSAESWLEIVDEYLRAAAEWHGAGEDVPDGTYRWADDERALAFRTMYARAMVTIARDDHRNSGWIRVVRNLVAKADTREFRTSSVYLMLEAYGEALGRMLTAGDDNDPEANGVVVINEILRENLSQWDSEVPSMEEIYCSAMGWVLDDTPDPADGESALQFLGQLLREAMHDVEESGQGSVFGQTLLARLLALPQTHGLAEEHLQGWVERIDDLCVDMLLEMDENYPPRYLVADYYGYAVGQYALGDDTEFEKIRPWLSHIETRMNETMGRPAVEVSPSVFSRRSYASAVRSPIMFTGPERADEHIAGFSEWLRRLVGAGDHTPPPGVVLAQAQGRGLENIADAERLDDIDADIEAWFGLYDSQIQADATADWHDLDPATYYTLAYGGALSRRQFGRPWDPSLMPRRETRWVDCLTERLQSVAESQAAPGEFVLSVYSDAAAAWIRSDEPDEVTIEWVDALVDTCVRTGRGLEATASETWFRESPDAFGRLLADVAASTRDDRTRRGLASTVFSVVEDTMTAAENPLSAATYTTQVFTAAFTRTVGADREEYSFLLSELIAMFRRADLTTVSGPDEGMVLAAAVGNAIAEVVVPDRPAPHAESWLREIGALLRDLPPGIADRDVQFVTATYGVVRSRLDSAQSVAFERVIDDLLLTTAEAVSGTTSDPAAISEAVETIAEELAVGEAWEPDSVATATATSTSSLH